MLYEIKTLTKTYGERVVLDLSISLESGKIIGLLGPNGAGKTSLLELLAFLSPPTTGEIRYKNERVDVDKSDVIRLRRKVVLVQQSPVLFTTTVLRNVAFPLKLRGVVRKRREEVAGELLGLVGMESFSHKKAHRLSGGETQRVAIARALACDPEVILLDEPTASVDIENQFIIERIIRNINRLKGISIVLTTHDMVQASRLSDEIVYLRDGRISEHGHENFFSGHVEKSPGPARVCIIQDNVAIPVKTEKNGKIRISIDPGAIRIVTPKTDIPQDNFIKGRLIQLTDEKGYVRALVDIGVPLGVFVPKNEIRDIHMRIGESVWITIDRNRVVVL